MFKNLFVAIVLFILSLVLSSAASLITKDFSVLISKASSLICSVMPFLIFSLFNKSKEKILSVKEMPVLPLFFFSLFVANIFAYFESIAVNAEKTTDIFTSAELLIYIVFSVLIVPLAEEFIYRKNLFSTLFPCGILPALLISSLMFSAVHPLGTKAYSFIMGCALCLIYLSGGFKLSFLFHMFNNILNVVLYYLQSVFGEKVDLYYIILITITGIISVFVLAKKLLKKGGGDNG